jgi:hypothetical protein
MIDNIKQNLQNLEIVCEKFPILDSYRKGSVNSSKLYNLGLNEFVNFIDYLKRLESFGLKPYYDETIKYRQLKKKLVELAPYEKSAKTFSKKSEEDFLLMITNEKMARRYTRNYNQSYFSGLFKGESLILGYLISKLKEVEGDINILKIGSSPIIRYAVSSDKCDCHFESISSIFNNNTYYRRIIPLPKFRNLEFEMVDTFINKFNETLGDFDFRKCNWNLLQSKIVDELSNKFCIDPNSTVKAINDIERNGKIIVEKDKHYKVISSSRGNDGFLMISISIDNNTYTLPYYNFEEISRMRDDLLNQLFGDSGS